ncbi:MAG: hypothetical protein E7012_02155 [Alphaproteobacteria bacterium]|nr:hypothetical protein [Alphaproteobacteria bacterium]
MKNIVLLLLVVLVSGTNVFAQETTITQDFLLDPNVIASVEPKEDAVRNAEESARQLLEQKPREWRKRNFPNVRKMSTMSTSPKQIQKNQIAPFGLIWKASINATKNQGIILTKIEEKDYPNSFSATNLPKEIDDFSQVDVSFGEDDMLWRVIAYGKLLDDDASATKVLRLYNIYSALLTTKYGNKQEFFTPAQIEVKVKNDSGRETTVMENAPIGNPQFLSQLQSGSAVLYSTYNNSEVGAALAINVDGDGKSYIVLDYKNLALLRSKEKRTLDAL